MKKIAMFIFILYVLIHSSYAKNNLNSAITKITDISFNKDNNTIITSDSIGFITIWDIDYAYAKEVFQLSNYQIAKIALRPGISQIAILETDSLSFYRISVWDYTKRKKLFSLRFKDPIDYLNYSANGNFLMISRNAQKSLVTLDPENGSILSLTQGLQPPLQYLVTGDSEKSIFSYSESGEVSYIEAITDSIIKKIQFPSFLNSINVFRNNRFISGIKDNSLFIIDAINGEIIKKIQLPDYSTVFTNENDVFLLVSDAKDSYLYNIISNIKKKINLSEKFVFSKIIQISKDTYITCDSNSNIGMIDITKNSYKIFDKTNSYSIKDFCLVNSNSFSSFLAIVNSSVVHVPSLWSDLENNQRILARPCPDDYNKIISINENYFVLWSDNNNNPPLICNFNQTIDKIEYKELLLNSSPLSVDSFNNKIVFIQTDGTLSVYDLLKESFIYTTKLFGVNDVTFVDEQNILLAKSADIGMPVPLLRVNIITGETTPLPITADSSISVIKGGDYIYTILLENDNVTTKTLLYRLDLSVRNYGIQSLMEYRAEDLFASVAEIDTTVVSNLGGELLYAVKDSLFYNFERAPALTVKIQSSERHIITLGMDNSINWYNPINGIIDATLSFDSNNWTIFTKNGNRSGTLSKAR